MNSILLKSGVLLAALAAFFFVTGGALAAPISNIEITSMELQSKSRFDPTALSWMFDGDLLIGNGPLVDDDESVSADSVSTLLKEGELYPAGANVIFTVSGAQFSLGTNEVTLLRNESLVKNLTVDADSIIAPGLLVDGVNNIVLYTNDNGGNQLTFSITLWAGTNSAYISVLNESGQSVTANLKLRLADDETVGLDAVAEGGCLQRS